MAEPFQAEGGEAAAEPLPEAAAEPVPEAAVEPVPEDPSPS